MIATSGRTPTVRDFSTHCAQPPRSPADRRSCWTPGGAARAIAVELALAGADSITIVNRDVGRGSELATLVADRTPARASFVPWTGMYRVPSEIDFLINATAVGLAPDSSARLKLDVAGLRPGMVVADVILNPPRTRLIRDAEERGCTVLDGLGMLVNQGAIGIRHWVNIDADRTAMRQVLEDLFAGS